MVRSDTIDSPLQNLAIYRQLMREGSLGEAVNLPADWLVTAARGLGAAADKTGKVSVDMVVYVNEILGLTDLSVQTMLDRQCINVKEEVKGKIQLVQKCFLDYSGHNYDRGGTSGRCPARGTFRPEAPRGLV